MRKKTQLSFDLGFEKIIVRIGNVICFAVFAQFGKLRIWVQKTNVLGSVKYYSLKHFLIFL